MIKYSIVCNRYKRFLPKESIENTNNFEMNLNMLKKSVNFDQYEENVFGYHHGLKYAKNSIIEYIKH